MIKYLYLKKQFNDNFIFHPTPCLLLACKTEVRSVSRLRLLLRTAADCDYLEEEKLLLKFFMLIVHLLRPRRLPPRVEDPVHVIKSLNCCFCTTIERVVMLFEIVPRENVS